MSALSPQTRRLLSWAPAGVGVVAFLLLLWLAAGGFAHTGAVVLAMIALTGAATAITLRVRRDLGRPPGGAGGGPPRSGNPVGPVRQAFDTLSEPVLIVASQAPAGGGRRVVMANRASQDLFQIPPEGGQLTSAVRDPKVLEAIEAGLLHGTDSDVDFASGGQHGRHWRAEVRAIESAEADGRRVLVHFRDETEARRLERMRADFMANASHELRSPLASLTGFIETLKGAARDDPEARERFLDIMAVQGDRMGRLIADLLSLSRIELDEHIPPSGKADLAMIASDVADALTPVLAARGLTLSLKGAAKDEALVVGDRDQLVQVVQNLVENALKYSPDKGSVEVEVTPSFRPLDPASRTGALARAVLLRPAHQAGARYTALKVRDHGPGIEAQKLPRLTERFYRVEGQKSGDRLGTGLGLAIVKHIVNRHRGGLIVESAPGEGSVFTIYLPAAQRPAEPSTPSRGRRNKSVMQAS